MADIRGRLAEFGADPSAARLFDDECAELLPYTALMMALRTRDATLGAVEAGVNPIDRTTVWRDLAHLPSMLSLRIHRTAKVRRTQADQFD